MNHKQHMYSLCQQYKHKPVQIQTADQQVFHGIIEEVDDDNVYLIIPEGQSGWMGMAMDQNMRQFGYNPYSPYSSYPFSPYSYSYSYYPYYPSPFRRVILPLAALAAISLLPYF